MTRLVNCVLTWLWSHSNTLCQRRYHTQHSEEQEFVRPPKKKMCAHYHECHSGDDSSLDFCTGSCPELVSWADTIIEQQLKTAQLLVIVKMFTCKYTLLPVTEIWVVSCDVTCLIFSRCPHVWSNQHMVDLNVLVQCQSERCVLSMSQSHKPTGSVNNSDHYL